jgi:hypothetical protein
MALVAMPLLSRASRIATPLHTTHAASSRSCLWRARYPRSAEGTVARPQGAASDNVLLASLGFVASGTAVTTLFYQCEKPHALCDEPQRVLYRNDDDSVTSQLRMAYQSFKRRAQAEVWMLVFDELMMQLVT